MRTTRLETTIDEERAFRIALKGSWLSRRWLALRAGIALARDPSDTKQVFILATAIDGQALPRLRRELEASPGGRELIVAQPSIDSSGVDFDQLRSLPADTIGGAYVRMLDAKGLDPDVFKRPPHLPEDWAYVSQRIRQSHDLWHLLTGLETDVPGEVALQAFTYAQLRLRVSWTIAVFGTLLFSLRYPRMLRMVRSWYRRGRRTPYLLAVGWEKLWNERLDDVRARFGLKLAADGKR